MENITAKEFLSSIESNTVYRNCTFYLGEQHFFKVKNSHFYNCGFYNSALFLQLENCKFIDCDFIGKFALELKNLKRLPVEIFGYEFLTHLTMEDCEIEYLPQEIEQLQNLVELKIISCYQLGVLPKEIGNLQSLKHLYLDGHRNINIPKEIGNLQQLQALVLQSSLFTQLPPQIGNLACLRYLHVNTFELLPSEISNLKSLEYLSGFIDPRDIPFVESLIPHCQIEHCDKVLRSSSYFIQ